MATSEAAEIAAAVAGRTICSSFLDTVARQPDEVALRWADDGGGGWSTWSWSEYANRVARVAAGLVELGVAPGDRVALLVRNRPEFHLLDLGALFAGATPVSLYNSSPPEQIGYVLDNSQATLVVAETADMAARVGKVRAGLPSLRTLVAFDAEAEGTTPLDILSGHSPLDLGAAAATVTPDDLATVIYTSGTTGAPKGVMLTHRNVVSCVESLNRSLGWSLRGLRTLSYLPMAHIAERMTTHYIHVIHGSVVTTCPDLTEILRYMVDVRPQWWFCAPRMWDKLRAGVEAMVMADAAEQVRFADALAVGTERFAYSNEGRALPDDLAERWRAAREETIRPLLARIGLDEVKVGITGSAPTSRLTHEFFLHCGVPLFDVYGQSETSGFISWDPDHIVPGTSGRPAPGVEVTLAADGEVLARGPNVFIGYLNDQALTAEVLDNDGWVRTGDIGRFDDEGNLTIVDRKKEIIVPSSGHNVSPVALEAALKESPLIGQACAVGDGRPLIGALVVLDPDVAPAWARQHGLTCAGLAALAESPEITALIQDHVDAINTRFARAEQVRVVRVLGEEWLPDSDLLTPTAKLKRRGVHQRYSSLIDEMYGEETVGQPR